MPDLARIGMTALPPGLREQVERLEDAEPELAAIVRADVKRMAGLLAIPTGRQETAWTI